MPDPVVDTALKAPPAAPAAAGPADAGAAEHAGSVSEAEGAPNPGVDGAEGEPDTPEAAAARAARKAAQEEAEAREAALRRLMYRISAHADFPSLRDSIRTIQKITRSETAHLRALTDDVLNDVALTSKLLRIINAAYYTTAGAGTITSIQRALALVGFQTVGMLAASLKLFERLPKGEDGAAVRALFSRALMSGLLAESMCHQGRHLEHAYLTALFLNLGTMLVAMHFPEDHAAIESRLADEMERTQEPVDDARRHAMRQRISKDVLGLAEEELGLEVASQWGWPASLLGNLRRLHPEDPEQAAAPGEYVRMLCTASDELAVQLHALPPAATAEEAVALREGCVKAFALRVGGPLSLDAETLPATAELAVSQWKSLGEMLGVAAPAGGRSAGARGKASAVTNPSKSPPHPSGNPRGKEAANSAGRARPPPPRPDPKAQAAVSEALSDALVRISQVAMSERPLPEVVREVLSELRQAMSLRRMVLALRDPATGELRGKLGVGEHAAVVSGAMRVPLAEGQDLFSVLCRRGQDTLIADSADPVIAGNLPRWYTEHVHAPTFVLLPIVAGGRTIGLLWGDRADAGTLHLGERELSLLQAVRNQLVMAIRLRGNG